MNFFVSFVYMLYLWLLRSCWLGGSSLAPEAHHQFWWQHSSQRQNLPESIFLSFFFSNNFGLDMARSFGVKWLNHLTLTLWHLRWQVASELTETIYILNNFVLDVVRSLGSSGSTIPLWPFGIRSLPSLILKIVTTTIFLACLE